MSEDTNPTRTEGLPSAVTGDIRRKVFVFAMPVLLEQLLAFMVGFYDTYLSGHLEAGISTDATSAIGLAAYVGWLASMLFALVGAGTTALVARYRGAGDLRRANQITNQSISLASAAGLVIFAVIFASAPQFARMLGMEGAVERITIRYLRIDAIGYFFSGVSLVAAAALRGAGDMRSPMWVFGLVSVLNVIVSRALVYGVGPFPQLGMPSAIIEPMGIDGIVTGTIIARVTGGLIMIGALVRGLSGLRLTWGELSLRGGDVIRISRIGGPAALDGAIMWVGHFLFLMIIASIGQAGMESSVFAAHIVGIRVEAITYLPAIAWGLAAATIVGQSLGAGEKSRAVRSGHEAALQCSLMGVAISLAFYFGAGAIYSLMHRDPAVAVAGVPAFELAAFFQIPLVIAIVYVHALRGAGETRFPLVVTVVSVFLVRLPIAYVCAITLDGGLYGAWIGMCADMAVRCVLIAGRYTMGRWVETVV